MCWELFLWAVGSGVLLFVLFLVLWCSLYILILCFFCASFGCRSINCLTRSARSLSMMLIVQYLYLFFHVMVSVHLFSSSSVNLFAWLVFLLMNSHIVLRGLFVFCLMMKVWIGCGAGVVVIVAGMFVCCS